MKYPFHYEVRMRLFKFDKEQEQLEDQIKRTDVFADKSPLENREDAFALFEDYLYSLKENNRLLQDSRGNYVIRQPQFLVDVRKKHGIKPWENVEDFGEELSVCLVVDDETVDRCLDQMERGEYKIHCVASFEFEEQDIVDNLELAELELYDKFEIDTTKERTTVYHYGLDYAESGEDEKTGAERFILRTPYQWQSKADYILQKFRNYHREDMAEDEKRKAENKLEIGKEQTGITYKSLFGDCLAGATTVELHDPFIRLWHQQQNFIDFIKLLGSQRTWQTIHLTLRTWCTDESQKEFLLGLKEFLEENDDPVQLEVEFDKDVHDRYVKTNTGWTIQLGRGLDIYEDYSKNVKNREFLKRFPEYRTCRDTILTYVKTQKTEEE